ncbi:MAG TPA: RNA polymerase sigma factor RpoD/SigA [Candidatus Polarisedimenticolia bacterium]|nr:RNA polymerase sigma factor RpoD/SigA [Candidatus Polarisedimenticolia bacterium]
MSKSTARPDDGLLQRYLHDLEECRPLQPAEELDLAHRMRRARERLVAIAGSLPVDCRAAVLGRLTAKELTPDLPYARLERLVNRLMKAAAQRRECGLDRLAHLALESWTELDQARSTFVSRNLRLVVHIAKRYARHGVPLLDLVQEANVGLMRAVDKFDPRHGTRFGTYAPFWIVQAIGRETAVLSRVVRVPDYQAKRRRQLARGIGDLKQRHGRMPTIGEIAAHTALPVDLVRDALDAMGDDVDLDEPADGAEGPSLMETLVDGEATSLLETISNSELLERLHEALAGLDPRQRTILSMHYGLNDGDRSTLQQIGEKLKVTRERVRQVEAEAISVLRTRLAGTARNGATVRHGARRPAPGPAWNMEEAFPAGA